MKPIYIKMRAFGSYQEETIDFTNVNQGLFLITGDTGAGKTTIFDAITYALYGKTSGGKRNGEMMCSQYAPAGMRTEVIFRFAYNGKEYTVTRSPEQPNWKKKEENGKEYYQQLKTSTPAKVELLMPDGTVWSGKKREIDNKIEEIIGLTVEQFTQIAMLAQGEFMKLLHATSEDRKEIFARIFDTGIYALIEKKIGERAKTMNIQLLENKKDIIRELERIRCVEDSSFQEDWDSYEEKFSESDKERLLKLISDICLEGEEKKKEIGEKKGEIQQQLDSVKREIQMAETVNGILKELEEEQNRRLELEEELPKIKELEEKVKKGEKAALVQRDYQNLQEKEETLEKCKQRLNELERWQEENTPKLEELKHQAETSAEKYEKKAPELHGEIAELRKNLANYDELDQWEKKAAEIEKEVGAANDKAQELEQNKNERKEEQKTLAAATEELKNHTENIEVLKEKMEREKSRKAVLKDIQTYLLEWEKKETAWKRVQEEYVAAEREEQQKQANYDDLYHHFIESQATVLRAGLKEGEPCPVCGSIHHVGMVKEKEDRKEIVNEKMLQKAKEELEKAAKNKNNAGGLMQQSEIETESIRRLLEDKYRSFYDEELIIQDGTRDKIALDYYALNQGIQELEQRRKIVAQNMEMLEENEKRLKEIDTLLEILTVDIENQQKEMKEIERKQTECSIYLKQLKENLTYPDRKQAEKKLNEKETEVTEIKNKKEKSEREYQEFIQILNEKKGQLSSERENLSWNKESFHEAESIFEHCLNEYDFENTDSFLKAVLTKEEIRKLQDILQRYREKELLVKNNLERLRRDAEGKEKIDITEYQEKQKELKNRQEELEEEDKKISILDNVNRTAFQKGRNLYAKRDKWREQAAILNILDSTANGKISKKRMNFQTYIQRRYFRQIINCANERLYPMSGNQFILQCREIEDLGTQGTVGLDLDVYSIVNDQTRDVKTLSGGESFMAALSMALGMADIIQNSMGSIHIDTMFIDEGFGSLSEDTRNQAIRILNELSGGKRFVGIISHVSELKAQVETKLVVSKTDKGSKAKWEIM